MRFQSRFQRMTAKEMSRLKIDTVASSEQSMLSSNIDFEVTEA